jgi:hypothetical protein
MNSGICCLDIFRMMNLAHQGKCMDEFWHLLSGYFQDDEIRKPFAVPKHFPRESTEACPILQTLGVIYSIEWALRHCDTVIGECIVSARPSPFSSARYLGNAIQRRFSISAPGSVYDARCEPNLPTVLNMKLPAAETDY